MVSPSQALKHFHKISRFLRVRDAAGDFTTPNGNKVCVNLSECASLVASSKDRGHKVVTKNKLRLNVINAGGRVSDRLEFGEPLREFIIGSNPDIFAVLETMTFLVHFSSVSYDSKNNRNSFPAK